MTSSREVSPEFLNRPLRDVHRDDLVALLAAGRKPRKQHKTGLEIELLAFERGERGVDLVAARRSRIEALLLRLRDDGAQNGGDDDGTDIEHARYTFEPGGQVEIATPPYDSLFSMSTNTTALVRGLVAVGEAEGLVFLAAGHHPWVDAMAAERMHSDRYDVMRKMLPLRGSRGLDMMHLTASVQCAVDFESESEAISKVRTAARVSPFVAALCAASPFSRGRPNGMKSERYEVWRDVDAARCGLWPEMVDGEGLTFARYVKRALEVPAMLFVRDGQHVRAEPIPFQAYVEPGFRGTDVTVWDFVEHLTTLFPEIRLKHYIELRGADSLVPKEAVAIGAFWRGILDDRAVREAIDERLSPLGFPELLKLQANVARLGLEARSEVGEVGTSMRWLLKLAEDSLKATSPGSERLLLPLIARADANESPADEMLRIARHAPLCDALLPFILKADVAGDR